MTVVLWCSFSYLTLHFIRKTVFTKIFMTTHLQNDLFQQSKFWVVMLILMWNALAEAWVFNRENLDSDHMLSWMFNLWQVYFLHCSSSRDSMNVYLAIDSDRFFCTNSLHALLETQQWVIIDLQFASHLRSSQHSSTFVT